MRKWDYEESLSLECTIYVLTVVCIGEIWTENPA